MEKYKREIDLNLAPHFETNLNVEKVKLAINKDTSYDIYYDICEYENERYLFIKMIENTANAPFYYNRSYSIKDLHNLHKIFKADDIDEAKQDLKTLFNQGKICLNFDKDENIIIMELDVILFADNFKINFDLYREMIPVEEKDQKLIELYNINRKILKKIKEISLFKENYKGNKNEINIIEKIRKTCDILEIPGIENVKDLKKEDEKKLECNIDDNSNNFKKSQSLPEKKEEEKDLYNSDILESSIKHEEEKDEKDMNNSDIKIETKKSGIKKKKLLINKQRTYENGNLCYTLNLENIYDFKWEEAETQLICDEKNSNIKPSSINSLIYEENKIQYGVFYATFNKNDMSDKNKCVFHLYVKGVRLDNSEIKLKFS